MNHEEKQRWISSQRSARPQFNYFYGSTTTTTTTGTTIYAATSPRINDEQDSLVGEELVSTDNEGEPVINDDEYQRKLIIGDDSQQRYTRDEAEISERSTARNVSSPGAFTSYPILVFLFIVGGLSVLVLLLVPLQPRHFSPQTHKFNMPFPLVDRADFGDPVESFMDMDLFHSSLVLCNGDTATDVTAASTSGVGHGHDCGLLRSKSFSHPFPTGAFWTNLVVRSPDGGSMSYPIAVYPFAYRWSSSSLTVSYPAGHRVTGSRKVQDPFIPEMTLTTEEEITKRYVVKYDPLSVTLRFDASLNSSFETTLVQGSPYVTVDYSNATPVMKPLSIFSAVLCPGDVDDGTIDLNSEKNEGRRLDGFGVCSIDESDPKYTSMRGVQFVFKTPEGISWLMFASEPMNLIFDKITKATVYSAGRLSGVIRLAYIQNNENGIQKTFESSTGFRRLIYHSDVYPVGSFIDYAFHKSSASSLSSPPLHSNQKIGISTVDAASSHATVTFKFETRSMLNKTTNTDELMMLALPHHVEVISKSDILSNEDFDVGYTCIKGNMTPIVGSTWTFDEPLYDMEFDNPIQAVDDNIKSLILEQVQKDLAQVLPDHSENVYGYGKQVARLAQLAHIADQLEITGQGGSEKSQVDEKESVLTKAKMQLSKYLEAYLSSDVSDILLFDTNMGGICSINGLRDKDEDFGNGRYNDHHFHYGYFLYASAIMGKLDPTFIDRFGTNVDALFHDIAHSSNGNSQGIRSDTIFFPMSRHKSWFDGHSFATGMFPFGNGKSQESSSEAVNCYYGAYLWSVIRHEKIASDVTDFTRLLFSSEVRSAKMYWHMFPSSATASYNNDNNSNNSNIGYSSRSSIHPHIYPSDFEENYMVGNVAMLDAAVNTWFGDDLLYVHLINVLPITAATRLLFNEDYLKYEYPYLMSGRSSVEMAWRGYSVSIHAIIDPNQAWEEARGLVSNQLDSALSKSQVYYFISQQPGFNASLDLFNQHRDEIDSNENTSASTSTTSSSCENNPRCMELNLTGECCPTSENTFLGCCDIK